MSRKIRQIRVEGNIAYVPLTQGYEAIIDTADVPLVEGVNWFAKVRSHAVYAVNSGQRDQLSGKQYTLRMHRLILGAKAGVHVDHINSSGIDNRRCNLRLVTPGQNNKNARVRCDNTSGLKGASLDKRHNKWRSRINVDGVSIALGYYDTAREAHQAYCEASRRLHGEYGRVK